MSNDIGNGIEIALECAYCGLEFGEYEDYAEHVCAGEKTAPGYCSAVREFTAPVMLAKESIEAPDSPIIMQPESVDFVQKMVAEEMEELSEAETIAEQADALIDAIYYICDTAVRHGINLDRLFVVVHSANMQKVQDGKILLSPEGKVLKPEGFEPPDVEKEINHQQEEGSWS